MNDPTSKRRRLYTPQQKQRLWISAGREPLRSEVARRLNISLSALSSWVRQARIDRGEGRPIDRGLLTTEERETQATTERSA